MSNPIPPTGTAESGDETEGFDERMVQHGLIKRRDGELQLCSPDAEIPSLQVVWVPESLAAKQVGTIHDYHEFQEKLAQYLTTKGNQT